MSLIILAILVSLVLLTIGAILFDGLIQTIKKYCKESSFEYGDSKYKEVIYER